MVSVGHLEKKSGRPWYMLRFLPFVLILEYLFWVESVYSEHQGQPAKISCRLFTEMEWGPYCGL